MTSKAAFTVIGSIIIFALLNTFTRSLITGTDSGSRLMQNALSVVCAAAVIIGTVMLLQGGKGGGKAKASKGHAKGR